MNVKKARLKLFDVFSGNLKLFLVKNGFTLHQEPSDGSRFIEEDLYICPLCMNGFLRITLDQSMPNPLTIEHVPPENSGGKPMVLLCKKCNSSKGHEKDYIIPKILESEYLSKGKSRTAGIGKIRLFPGSNLAFQLEVDSDKGLVFHLDD